MSHVINSAHKMYERVRYLRWASQVERAHVHPHLLRYSIGQHTHDVVSILIIAWKATHGGTLPRAELLVAAHVHDAAELVTGDCPSPIKDLMGDRLRAIDRNVEKWLDCDVELSDEEINYLNAADRVELWLWCRDEAVRGNVTFLPWAEGYTERWEKSPLPPVFMDLMELTRQQGGRNPSWQELAEIGGLT